MTEAERDAAYSHLCRTMTELGEASMPLFLARFALLAMSEIGDAVTVERLIADAASDIGDRAPARGAN